MEPQSIAAFIFIALLTIYFFLNRKKFQVQKIISYLLYFAMYKTKLGLKTMDSWSRKFPRFFGFLSVTGIIVGFLGMALIAYSLIENVVTLLTKPEAVPGVGIVLPFEVKGAFFVPFFYWIVSIFIIAVIHEFSHGLIARYYNIPLKSSGFAFLAAIVPIIPAAFVEPNENIMKKRPAKQQLGVLAAGPFSNIITGFLFFAMFLFIGIPIVHSVLDFNGVKITDFSKENSQTYPAELSGMQKNEIIREIENKPVIYVENFTAILDKKKPGEQLFITTDKAQYTVTLAYHPNNISRAYLGVIVSQHTEIKPSFKEKYGTFLANFLLWFTGTPDQNGLFFWLFLLSFGIGLFNLVPIGPIDGGRILHVVLLKYFSKEKATKVWMYVGIFFLLLVFVNIGFGFVR